MHNLFSNIVYDRFWHCNKSFQPEKVIVSTNYFRSTRFSPPTMGVWRNCKLKRIDTNTIHLKITSYNVEQLRRWKKNVTKLYFKLFPNRSVSAEYGYLLQDNKIFLRPHLLQRKLYYLLVFLRKKNSRTKIVQKILKNKLNQPCLDLFYSDTFFQYPLTSLLKQYHFST